MFLARICFTIECFQMRVKLRYRFSHQGADLQSKRTSYIGTGWLVKFPKIDLEQFAMKPPNVVLAKATAEE